MRYPSSLQGGEYQSLHVAINGYTLLDVATFFAQLADLVQEHTNLSGKRFAEFV